MSAIKCGACAHENDQTRVFCQNCGARLERPEGAAAPKISGPTKVPTGPLKVQRQGMGPLGLLLWVFRRLLSTAFLGALIAMLIQMSRAPEGIPPAKPGNEAAARQLFESVQSFSDNIYPRGLDVTQDQINNYLAARILPAQGQTEGMNFRAEFQRAFVVIGSGKADLFIEQKLLGHPVYLYLTAVPGAPGEPLRYTGGGVGRIPVHEKLVPLLERVISPVVTSAQDVSPLAGKATTVVFVPGVAKLNWPGAKPAGR